MATGLASTSDLVMDFNRAVSFLSALYFVSLLGLALLTNIHPFLPYGKQDLHIIFKKNNETSILDNDDKIWLGFGVNQGISFILGKSYLEIHFLFKLNNDKSCLFSVFILLKINH